MRKFIYIILASILVFSLAGCGNSTDAENEETPSVLVEESQIQEIEPDVAVEEVTKTIRLNGIDYFETNRTISVVEDVSGNTIAGEIKSFVTRDKFPEEDEQSNFGVGYQYQVKDNDFAYVNMNGTWHIFCSCDDAEEIVTFHDRVFMKKELSSETLEWLQKYNELSEEEQLATDSIPAELIDEVVFNVEDAEEEQEESEMESEIPVEENGEVEQISTEESVSGNDDIALENN